MSARVYRRACFSWALAWAVLPGSAQGAGPSDAPEAARAWLDGESGVALAALARLPATRERDFNHGVLLLYRGEAAAAERVFRDLHARDPGWLPAARWLARAQKDLGRTESGETALAILKMPGATSRDHLFAARLLVERNDLPRARDSLRRAVASEDDLYLAWVALADLEKDLGHPDAARVARGKADALYPVGLSAAPTPPQSLPTPLRYRAKYLFFPLATLTISDRRPLAGAGRPAWLRTAEARSTGVNVFFRINSRFESTIAPDGALLGHRNLSNDSASARHESVVDVDPATGAFRARQARDGLFLYDILPVPGQAQPHDGLSMIEAARAVARTRTPLSVLRIVDSTWKGSVIRPARTERLSWQHQRVDTVCVEIGITSRSAAGTVGILQLWISADERAIPYRARMGIAVGSVTLELMP